MQTEQKELTAPEEAAKVEEKPVRRPLPAPGKPLSFEEALERSATENKELLERLAQ